jgi:uncharacterized membrane protein YphA (DoxX/SURF4 family)
MKSKVILVLSILFGLMMVNSGLNKFFNYMPVPEMPDDVMAVFGSLIQTKWILPLVAMAEIVGGVLIAIPKTRALGAIVIFPVMVGIVVHHLIHDIRGIAIGLVLFLINFWVIIEHRENYLPMVK